jgi:Domain of unknown function (DUF222)
VSLLASALSPPKVCDVSDVIISLPCSRQGNEEGLSGLGWVFCTPILIALFLILLGKRLVIEHIFEYNGGMQLGDHPLDTRVERSRLDAVLDKLDTVYTELLGVIESGGFGELERAEKVAAWQRVEILRNRLPLIDHRLIADAEASDLAKSYCNSTMTQFLVRVLQLSHREAVARVRAAAALGPRSSMLGEQLEPLLPRFAALQYTGAISPEKVQIVERAMDTLSRPGVDPEAVATAEELLGHYAPTLGIADLKRFANRVVNAADPDGPEPIDDQLQHDRRYLELKQRRDGMWHLHGKLTSTVDAQLNAILDPLAKPRSSSINKEQGQTVKIADGRPSVQRLHDALDEMCGRVLKSGDRPSVGGAPASVIVTVSLEDLLAKAGLVETVDGTQLTSEQLLRIADEAEIWPTIINHNNIPLALGRSQRLASTGQTMALITRDGGCSFPGCDHPPAWCDRHHILDWISGGRTDVDNLTFLCRYHHTHFLQKGWACQMNPDGLPEWIPPKWIDQQQRPQINARIQQLHTQHALADAGGDNQSMPPDRMLRELSPQRANPDTAVTRAARRTLAGAYHQNRRDGRTERWIKISAGNR